MENESVLIAHGKMLPLMETFYSVQGEGFNSGKPAFFIRLGGCDIGCRWCDVKESWNSNLHPYTLTDEIVKSTFDCPARAVVVTGGEPLSYNLNYLCKKLKENHILVFLETSGTHRLSGEWDWICLSPKKNHFPLEAMHNKADELKVIIQDESDFAWAEENEKLVHDNCLLYLQPEWSQRKTVIPMIVEYCKKHPQWTISLQVHKYMNIP